MPSLEERRRSWKVDVAVSLLSSFCQHQRSRNKRFFDVVGNGQRLNTIALSFCCRDKAIGIPGMPVIPIPTSIYRASSQSHIVTSTTLAGGRANPFAQTYHDAVFSSIVSLIYFHTHVSVKELARLRGSRSRR